MKIPNFFVVFMATPGGTIDTIKAIDSFTLDGSITDARRLVRGHVGAGSYERHGNGTIFVVEREIKHDNAETRFGSAKPRPTMEQMRKVHKTA